ncbi:MAG TPA: hypothetical protein PLK61_04020 [Nitrosomonas sp.]|nr:hypothetical protein [Nitrosomonas sp.]
MALLPFIGVPGLSGTGITGAITSATIGKFAGDFINAGGLATQKTPETGIGNIFNEKRPFGPDMDTLVDWVAGDTKIGDYSKVDAKQAKKDAEPSFVGKLFDLISEIFLRAIVVITGFIFVAAGLYMFNRQGGGTIVINQAARGAKSLAKKVTLQ